MTTREEFGSVEDWLKIARTDWLRVNRNLQEDDVTAAGFYLQQSVEKYLKAFLLLHGWKLKKIHELDALLDEAIKYTPELTSFYHLCERVTGYYLVERYPPFDDLGIKAADVERDLKEAKKLVYTMFPEEALNA